MTSVAQAQSTAKFDLPVQPLADSLRAVGSQTKVNLLFDPPLVAGKLAPVLKADLTADEALTRLLVGTGIEHDFLNETTVVLAKANAIGSKSGAGGTLGGAAGGNPGTDTPKEGSKSGSGSFRLAQATRGQDQSAVSVENVSPNSTETADNRKAALDEIVVTGSHIRGAQPSSPVISIDRDDINQSGAVSTADLVHTLPQSFGGGMNANVILAGGGVQNQNQYSGASSVNLRGFGSEATLTLVDGHRLAYSDAINAADVNVIPISAIERVDVLTDGASAIYGSDAIAGVVNFVLKKNFDGVQAGLTVGGAPDGGGLSQQYSALAGHTWEGGHALLSFEHFSQGDVDARDRSFTDPAVAGTTLLPAVTRNSLFVNMAQELNADLSVDFEALYTHRSSDQSIDFGTVLPGLFSQTAAHADQYGVTPTVTWVPTNGWEVRLAGNLAGNIARDPSVTNIDGTVLTGTLVQNLTSRLGEAQLSADGPLVTTPAGPIQVAVGTVYRHETFSFDQGYDGGTTFEAVSAARSDKSAYGEINAPLIMPSVDRLGLNALSLTLAARYDDYSDAGNSFVPKVGLVYAPSREISIKANWGKSFRAPDLFEEYEPQSVSLGSDVDPLSPTGTSLELSRSGGNTNLRPETSINENLSVEYLPDFWKGFRLNLTYFHIDYKNVIETPIQGGSLSNPENAPFVIRNPTIEQQTAALAGATFINNTGVHYDPSTVAAIVDGRYLNASTEKAHGVDLLANYRIEALNFSLNSTYLDLAQRISSASPFQQLSGTAFNPPRFRMRAGASWSPGPWTSSIFVNFVGPLKFETLAGQSDSIASFTTLDGQVGYEFSGTKALSGLRAVLSVQNLFNKNPPSLAADATLIPGINFDSTNASALGRFVSLQIVKDWGHRP